MDIFYEHITTRITTGMISSCFLDLNGLNLDFNQFVGYIEGIYSISDSNFNYKITYEKEESEKDYIHYVLLDNGIYVEIKTLLKSDAKKSVIEMDDTKIVSITAYSSQDNNRKLIKFMDVVNTFISKKKSKINNV